MTTSAATAEIPGYTVGTWVIDPVHSDVTFTVRHLGVSKVRGRFSIFEGEIVTASDLAGSSVTATIQAGSIDTNNEQRDGHVKSADFLDIEQFETLTFRSTGVRTDGEDYLVDGELTLHGVTRPVTLRTELGGFGPGMTEGSTVLGVSASTEINRSDFGVGATIPAAVVSEKIRIELNIEAGLQA
ncbi:YceI family protein [Qaidamihabitans albus]|uniref:YceI family protein n=1 Tax=Qaidamihabitans albus TaxID=2795733 RepID=UPI0018F1B25C|nr:YceI family protein [Qaidamihabitans albus]